MIDRPAADGFYVIAARLCRWTKAQHRRLETHSAPWIRELSNLPTSASWTSRRDVELKDSNIYISHTCYPDWIYHCAAQCSFDPSSPTASSIYAPSRSSYTKT